jgi:lipoprotein NlpI
VRVLLGLGVALGFISPARADDHPLPAEDRARLHRELDDVIAKLTERLKSDPKDGDALSRRGDARLMRGDFKGSVADYDAMVALDASLDAGHWRRGIAYFFAGEYAKAAGQFERYHTQDNVDRENGIWRFLSQVRAHGVEKAREGLLQYAKDDREPFPSVYRMFEGKTTPDQILKEIGAASIDDEEREKRLFYAHLYVGLHRWIEKDVEGARSHLRLAVKNTWGPKSGFGPRYMWHVGRLSYDALPAKKE